MGWSGVGVAEERPRREEKELVGDKEEGEKKIRMKEEREEELEEGGNKEKA